MLGEPASSRRTASGSREWEDERRGKSERVTTRVPCGEFFEARDEALKAHATQVDPDGLWFQVPLELQRAVWPTEDYELARSLVPDVRGADGYEDDLFAGLRVPASSVNA